MNPSRPMSIFVFSLRRLMLAFTTLAIILGIWSTKIEPFRRQASGLERFRELLPAPGPNDFRPPDYQDTLVPSEVLAANGEWTRRLLAWTIGDQHFYHVNTLRFPRGARDDDVRFVLQKMKQLQHLSIESTHLSDATMVLITRIPSLRTVELRYCDITDDRLGRLGNAGRITRLVLTGNPITDVSIEMLCGMRGAKRADDSLDGNKRRRRSENSSGITPLRRRPLTQTSLQNERSHEGDACCRSGN